MAVDRWIGVCRVTTLVRMVGDWDAERGQVVRVTPVVDMTRVACLTSKEGDGYLRRHCQRHTSKSR